MGVESGAHHRVRKLIVSHVNNEHNISIMYYCRKWSWSYALYLKYFVIIYMNVVKQVNVYIILVYFHFTQRNHRHIERFSILVGPQPRLSHSRLSFKVFWTRSPSNLKHEPVGIRIAVPWLPKFNYRSQWIHCRTPVMTLALMCPHSQREFRNCIRIKPTIASSYSLLVRAQGIRFFQYPDRPFRTFQSGPYHFIQQHTSASLTARDISVQMTV